MTDAKAEMSLDEVLSSIKKMVMDDEPPVLDLTDMVAQDGTVVKVKKCDQEEKNPDMSSFLRLIQEDAEDVPQDVSDNGESPLRKLKTSVMASGISEQKSQNRQDHFEKDKAFADLIKEMIQPLLQKWINENLPAIASKVVEAEMRRLLLRKTD
ncbi:MAG: DUF2497 domain-containing protein [Holosporaceae bacterium]|jgi:cell pole-organizing protein PopZ|nr:DUF2497 domain-containing protein [Holosporaceae bacterium]